MKNGYISDVLWVNPYTKLTKNIKKIFFISMIYCISPFVFAAQMLVYVDKMSGIEGVDNGSGVGIETESVNYVIYKLSNGQTFKVLFSGMGQMASPRRGYITCGNYVYSNQESSTDIWRECWNYLGNAPVWVDEYTLIP